MPRLPYRAWTSPVPATQTSHPRLACHADACRVRPSLTETCLPCLLALLLVQLHLDIHNILQHFFEFFLQIKYNGQPHGTLDRCLDPVDLRF